ncbi:hypothetical protein [Streptomyces sp. NPDC058457]|uniref:hypothetical protein n=1 Tax=Streptomyces sp. NPDC058457 TaxID=3346507 RepID=UPI0036632B97
MTAVAVAWAAAWNGNDPQRFAALFVEDGCRDTDHALVVAEYFIIHRTLAPLVRRRSNKPGIPAYGS